MSFFIASDKLHVAVDVFLFSIFLGRAQSNLITIASGKS